MSPKLTSANATTRQPLARRAFLRGTGAAIVSLPWLEAMSPTLGRRVLAGESATMPSPPRFLAICATLGFHTPFLFPENEGRDYPLTPYLQQLAGHRDHFTVFSGLSHPEQQGNNGHASEMTWLTSAQRPGLAGFRNSISIDQLIAQQIGLQTRFPYLALSTSGRSMSWNASGVEIPAESSPAKLFQALFIRGSEKQVAAELRGISRGQSILDTVLAPATRMHAQVSQRDREKLDQYMTSVRELEQRLVQSADWVSQPKPQVQREPVRDVQDKSDAIAKQDLMYEMIVLALQTDSTRSITLQLSGMNAAPKIDGVDSDWHGLSHHGKDPAKIDELRLIEEAEFAALSRFLTKMRGVAEGDRTLLDRTAVMFGSNLGNASAHDWRNLPIIVAGGDYRHSGYVKHDPQSNTPLANLLVSLAQRMGVEIDQFGTSTSAGVRGLDS